MKALLPSFITATAVCLAAAPVQGALHIKAVGFGSTKTVDATFGPPFTVVEYKVGPAIVDGSCGTTFCSNYFSGSTFTIRWELLVPKSVDSGEINFTFDPAVTSRPADSIWYDGVGTATQRYASGSSSEILITEHALTLSRIWFYDDGDPNSVPFSTPTMFVSASGVPEPTTWAMMAIGFGLLGGLVRRRKMVPLVSFA